MLDWRDEPLGHRNNGLFGLPCRKLQFAVPDAAVWDARGIPGI